VLSRFRPVPIKRVGAASATLFALALATPASASFTPETPMPVGGSHEAIAAADFNGDNRTDLIVTNPNTTGTVSVLLRLAGGGFSEQAPIPAGNNPRSIAIADFNKDGRPDFAVLDLVATTRIFIKDPSGNGFTVEPLTVSSFSGSVKVVAADFNKDTLPDLAMVGSTAVQAFLRNPGGGFTEEGPPPIVNYGPGKGALGLAAADFNGDTRPDLAVALSDVDAVDVQLRNSGPGFAAETNSPFAVGDFPRSIAVADFTGDGRPDLAVTSTNSTPKTTILVRQAAGGFVAEVGAPTAAASPSDIAVGDFNADGRPDFAISESAVDWIQVFLRGAGGGFSEENPRPPAGDAPNPLVAADFNGDNKVDLATGDNNSNEVRVLLNSTPITPPDTAIGGGPDGPTNDNTPTFSFSSTPPGAAFECRIDAAMFATCTSPFTPSALPDGQHTFEARAKSGPTADPTAASRAFRVDTVPPDTSVGGPSGPTADNQPSFTFGSTELGSSFECRLDGGALAACSSPFTTPALTLGQHAFEVRATDAAGNTDATPATRSFTVVERPVARFTVSPSPTCVASRTAFDGNASSSPAGPIRTYRFEYTERRSTAVSGTFTSARVVIADGTSARATHVFDWNIVPPSYGGSGRGSGGADRVFAAGSGTAGTGLGRDDADVMLTITDGNGITGTTTRRVTFAQHSPGSRVGCPVVFGEAFRPASAAGAGVLTSRAVAVAVRCRGLIACTMVVSFDVARPRTRAGARKVASNWKLAAARTRRVVIASGRASVAAGKSTKVRAKLTKKGRVLLRGRKKLRARVKIATISPTNKRVVRTRTVILKRG
jgi:hypothetical protein